MNKGPFLEIKIRVETLAEKEAFERAAREHRPVGLSVNQWMLMAARAQLERDALAAVEPVPKKKGGRT